MVPTEIRLIRPALPNLFGRQTNGPAPPGAAISTYQPVFDTRRASRDGVTEATAMTPSTSLA